MAGLWDHAQERASAALLSDIGDSARSLVVSRNHDATPVLMRFGRYQGDLEPCARYLVKEQVGIYIRWRTVRFDEFKKSHPRFPTTFGVLNLFAQSAQVSWDKAGNVQSQHIIIPPSILARSNGSTIMSAVENAVPSLTVESLKDFMGPIVGCHFAGVLPA